MSEQQAQLHHERLELLAHLEAHVEKPMVYLGFLWMVLVVYDLVYSLSPFLRSLSDLIWALFVVDFGVRLLLAPSKASFLKGNWLTALSIFVPALRFLRAAAALRILQVMQGGGELVLIRVLSTANRSLRALTATMGRRGFRYVAILTVIVTFLGAAGMFAFEHGVHGSNLKTYGSSLWWTAMIMTTMGSDYWPQTGPGRLLCLILALYAFSVFGYVTATIASWFIDQDASNKDTAVAGADDIRALQHEIRGLRQELRQALGTQPHLTAELAPRPADSD